MPMTISPSTEVLCSLALLFMFHIDLDLDKGVAALEIVH